MGDFHDTVSDLLDAFTRGISIIKRQKSNNLKGGTPPKTAAEVRLSKSLKKNKVDVENAYNRDLNRFGNGFAVGDGKLPYMWLRRSTENI
jgi:hypothetical protein